MSFSKLRFQTFWWCSRDGEAVMLRKWAEFRPTPNWLTMVAPSNTAPTMSCCASGNVIERLGWASN